jgi:hypothetical protein
MEPFRSMPRTEHILGSAHRWKKQITEHVLLQWPSARWIGMQSRTWPYMHRRHQVGFGGSRVSVLPAQRLPADGRSIGSERPACDPAVREHRESGTIQTIARYDVDADDATGCHAAGSAIPIDRNRLPSFILICRCSTYQSEWLSWFELALNFQQNLRIYCIEMRC